MEKKDIIVLGAGLTGLSCGYRLAAEKKSVLVLERNDYVGGLAASFRKDSYVFDIGPHRFHSNEEELIDFVKNELNIPLIEREKKTQLYFKNRYYEYPFKVEDLLKGLDLKTKIRSVFDFVNANIKKNLVNSEESFESYVKSRFGRTIYDIFFGPYTEKVWGIDPKFLDAEFAVQRIASKSLLDVVFKTFIQNTPFIKKYYHPHSPYKKTFYYPENGGIGTISEKLEELINENGGNVINNVTLKNIDRYNNRWKIQCLIGNSEKEFLADQLVSTIPLNEIIRLTAGENSTIYNLISDNIIYRSLVILFLVINKPEYSENNWIYYCEDNYPFNRISENKTFSLSNAPEQKTSLNLEITCFDKDNIFSMDKDSIYDFCKNGIINIGVNENSIDEYFVKMFSNAYCVFSKGYKKHLDTALKYINEQDNILSCGRQGLFRYVNMDIAIKMGLKSADYILNKCPKEDVLSIGMEKFYLG
ncbi:protoporphyrinogen/coproporphyrinogen oxidase [candidate division KSB1 bacterium]